MITPSLSKHFTSEIAAQALGLKPTGTPHDGDPTPCAMCGRHIGKGDLSAPLDVSKSFTDWLSLTPSKHICGWCDATTPQPVLRNLQRSVVTPHGIYPIAKDDNRAWFLLTPPEPPYSVVVSTGAMTAAFHLHWKTPVTLSNEIVTLRIDEFITTIRRGVLLRAIDQCKEMADLMYAHRAEAAAAGKRKKTSATASQARHPFSALDRGLSDPYHGRLRDDAVEAAIKAGRKDLIEALQDLSAGEMWALATLVKAKPAVPTKPEIITQVKAASADSEGN